MGILLVGIHSMPINRGQNEAGNQGPHGDGISDVRLGGLSNRCGGECARSTRLKQGVRALGQSMENGERPDLRLRRRSAVRRLFMRSCSSERRPDNHSSRVTSSDLL